MIDTSLVRVSSSSRNRGRELTYVSEESEDRSELFLHFTLS